MGGDPVKDPDYACGNCSNAFEMEAGELELLEPKHREGTVDVKEIAEDIEGTEEE